MKKSLLKVFMMFFISIQISGQTNKDAILSELGLPRELFTVLTYQEAKKNYYTSKPYDFSLNPSDTIILCKVDTVFTEISLFNKVIRYKFDMSEIVFTKGLKFNSCIFKKQAYFVMSQFRDVFNSIESTFASSVIFHNAKFAKEAVFNNTRFSLLEINRCEFNERVSFYECLFSDVSYLINSHFKEIAIFNNALFLENSNFSASTFEKSPLFWYTKFNDTTNFNYINLKDGIDFQSTKFNNYLGLNNSDFQGVIHFEDAFLPEWIDLGSIKTFYPIDFNFVNDSVDFHKYKINIYHTDPSKILLNNKFSLWFDNYLSIDQKNSIYKQYLDYLDNAGYAQIYKNIDIDYKDFLNKNYNGILRKLSSIINKLWWNYGYDKERIFIISFIIILLSSAIIFTKFEQYVSKVYPIKQLANRYKKNKSVDSYIKKNIMDYLVVFLYTSFIFFNLKLDFEKLSFKRFSNAIYILFIYAAGLICTAFIINLILTKI